MSTYFCMMYCHIFSFDAVYCDDLISAFFFSQTTKGYHRDLAIILFIYSICKNTMLINDKYIYIEITHNVNGMNSNAIKNLVFITLHFHTVPYICFCLRFLFVLFFPKTDKIWKKTNNNNNTLRQYISLLSLNDREEICTENVHLVL